MDQDGLSRIREAMFLWVDETLETKMSEARCDLCCDSCPSAMLLNCAAQNRITARTDGFLIPILTPEIQ
jgi:hypothetical protein